MPKQCTFCGSFEKPTRHHIIKREFNGHNQRVIILCRDCHSRLENQLIEYAQNVDTFQGTTAISVGGASLELHAGSTFVEPSEAVTLAADCDVFGCEIRDTGNDSRRQFEAFLHGGSVVTFTGSPSGKVYYSTVYRKK
ncbi:hypothetical protein GF323_07155 [Candidatus Woesearchaeota archaeon]|nr:hypothetical protein [Candidatus Woesearchaeota archaeon]